MPVFRTCFILFWGVILCCVPARAQDPLRLAVIAAMTGDAAVSSRIMFDAARYAADEINASGGLLGRHVEILEYDNQSSAIGSRLAAKAAVSAKADAVIGASWSAHSLAMAPVFEAAEIPMISPMSTNPGVTRDRRYVFRVCFTDEYQGKALAKFAYDDLGARRVVVLCNVDRAYSVGLADAFSEAFAALGGQIPWRGEFLLDVADYSALLRKTAQSHPDLIFLPGDYRDSSFIIGQARKMGLGETFLGGDSFGGRLYEYIGKLAEGSYYSTHWSRDNPSPRSQAFVKQYEAQHEFIKQTTIPMTYDAVMLWADAVRRAGSADGKAVRDALAATRDFHGVTGTISYQGTGDPRRPVIINRLENGGVAFIKEIVP